VAGEWLHSKVDRVIGAFDLNPPDMGMFPAPPHIFQSSTREKLDFTEQTLSVTLNQLVAREWALGARYRVSEADLEDEFPDIPASAMPFGNFRREQHLEATLQQINLYAIYNHSSGFFAQLDSLWSSQNNSGDAQNLRDEDFWHFNAHIGYRFPRRQAEIRLGLLNLTDQDYHLNPLNLTSELPRERTLLASLRFSF